MTSPDGFGRELLALIAPWSAEKQIVRIVVDGDERLLAQEHLRLGYLEEVLAMTAAQDPDELPDAPGRRTVADAVLEAVAALLIHERSEDRIDAPQIIRVNRVLWLLAAHPTAFTYSLGVYPLIILGHYLYWSRPVGPDYWVLLSGSGALFVAAIHFGPANVEPPADITNSYEPRIIGRWTLGRLVVIVAVLAASSLYGPEWRLASFPSASLTMAWLRTGDDLPVR